MQKPGGPHGGASRVGDRLAHALPPIDGPGRVGHVPSLHVPERREPSALVAMVSWPLRSAAALVQVFCACESGVGEVFEGDEGI